MATENSIVQQQQPPQRASRWKLYKNPTINDYAYKTFRPYSTKTRAELKELSGGDTIEPKLVYITGVPEGVSNDTNVALIERGQPLRLCICSNQPLTDQEFELIDKLYKAKDYPVPLLVNPIATIPTDYPPVNFIATADPVPSSLSRFVEYRYLKSRHQNANVLFNVHDGTLHRYVPPVRPKLVLIMPENFTKVEPSSGFFIVDENLIIRVYSRYLLSAAVTLPDHNLYSEISVDNSRTLNICKRILTNLDLHRITYRVNDQIYGTDAFITAVIGSVANINLPRHV